MPYNRKTTGMPNVDRVVNDIYSILDRFKPAVVVGGESGGITDHRDLNNLNSENYYHLTEVEYNSFLDILDIGEDVSWDDITDKPSNISALASLSVTNGNFLVSNGSTIVSRPLQNSDLPAIAITDTFVVNSQAAMLALSTAERGDVAVRTDLNKSFILKGDDYSKLEDWQELLTPTDTVLSVDGRTGVVSLSDKYQPLDTDLTAIAGLTHSNRHVLVSDGSKWTRRALAEDDLPSLSISKITNLQTTLDSKEPAISGTAYKVLSIQSDGSGVKTGCLRDLGNYAAIDNAERFAIIHSTDQAAISLQSQGGNRFWISSAPSVLNIGGTGTTAPENGQLQIYYNSRVVIPSLPLLVGKATATTGNPYKIEVEGNALVNGTLTVNVIPAKTTEVGVYLTHDNNTIKTRTAAQVLDDIGAAPATHTHSWSGITDKPSVFAPAAHTHSAIDLPAITGTENMVLSIKSGGSGVKTGSIYDDGNVALIGKTTSIPGFGYKLEVEGNAFVNGTLKANDFGDDWLDVSNSIIVPNVTIVELMVLIKKEGKRVTILFSIAGTANNSIPFVDIVGIPTSVNGYILGYDSMPSFTSVTKKGVVVCISPDGTDFMRILKSYGGTGESTLIFEEGSITYYTD